MVVGDRLFTSLEANRNRSRQNVQQQLLRAHLGRLALGPKERQSDERQGADAGDVEREQDIDREGGKRARRLLGRTVQDRGDREIAKERRQPDRRLTSWPQQQRAERRRKRPDHDRAGVDEAPQAELEQEREYDHQPKYQKGQNAQPLCDDEPHECRAHGNTDHEWYQPRQGPAEGRVHHRPGRAGDSRPQSYDDKDLLPNPFLIGVRRQAPDL